jgi:hypothetical protein
VLATIELAIILGTFQLIGTDVPWLEFFARVAGDLRVQHGALRREDLVQGPPSLDARVRALTCSVRWEAEEE